MFDYSRSLEPMNEFVLLFNVLSTFAYCNYCMFWDILRVNLFAAKVCFDEVGIYLGKSSVQSCLLGCGLVISSCNVLISPPPLDSLALLTHVARSFIPTLTDRLLC